MSTFQERIAEVLAKHYKMPEQYARESECMGCVLQAPAESYTDNDWDSAEWFSEHQAAMLAPLIKEAQAEAYDLCDGKWEAAHKMSHHEPWNYLPDANPYRSAT